MPRPAVKLSALRRIGWEVWDPIGIRDMVSDDYASGPADEYDSYLMVAFGMAQSGRSASQIEAYLSDIAARHIGLGSPAGEDLPSRNAALELMDLARGLT